MKRSEYLKFAINEKLYMKRAWMISAFAVFKNVEKGKQYFGQLVSEPWGMSYLDRDLTPLKITDSKPNTPLFTFDERVQIDNTWAPNCNTPQETSIGTLLYNLISLCYAFGTKIEYMPGRVSVKGTEKLIAPRLTTDPAPGQPDDPKAIYVYELIKYGRSLEYLKTMLQLCAYSSTPKGIVPPTGIKQFKQALNKKYEGQLRDPVKLAAYEKELLAFDDEFMKDDPSYKKFTSGKISNTSRKKLFLTVGTENAFHEGTSAVPITESLSEGWPTDPEKYVAMMNGVRVGSYARGAETVNGGVSAKILLRAANNFVMGAVDDCGTKLGIRRVFRADGWVNLIGRTVQESPTKKVLIDKDTPQGNYLGRVLVVRSPMYCRSEGDNICRTCAGERLARYKTGVTIPLTEISAVILAAAMAKMHNSGLSTARMTLDEIWS